MGNITINELPVATEVQDSDEIVVSQGTGSGDVKSSTLGMIKTYVADAISVTANNGLTNNNGTIQLGGSLTQNTYIGNTYDGTTNDVALQTNVPLDGTHISNEASLQVSLLPVLNVLYLSAFYRTTSNYAIRNYIRITMDSLVIGSSNGFQLQSLTFGNDYTNNNTMNPIVLSDDLGLGITYAANYNNTFVPLSLVTKQYVDGKIPDTSTFATDANVVHKTTDEVIDGNKTFLQNLTVSGLTLGTGNGTISSNPNILSNTALGLGVMPLNTGQENTGVGQWALSGNTSGFFNTAFGAQALATVSTGNGNTAVGVYALTSISTASYNTAVGNGALENTIGSNNTAIGLGAGGGGNGSGNIFIGYNAGGNASGDNKLFIANSPTDNPLIYGDFSTNILTINGKLQSTVSPSDDNDVVRLADLSGYATTAGSISSFNTRTGAVTLSADDVTSALTYTPYNGTANPDGYISLNNIPVVTIPFSSGGANPLVISNWAADYFPTYKNATFLVQFIDSDGNLQDRPDIGIKRIIDRTGAPVQTGISMDQPDYPNGQIVITYSNLNLI